jgi:glycosyltransferase involved in cell wall biosynthesis
MRTGKNPAKDGLPAYPPQRLGVALIVYIPFTEGYFHNALEVLGYQIASLRAATSEPFDLLIFDNGSCPEAVKALQEYYDQKTIDWLVLSRHNMGKAGAWNWIFAAMPNELICYADSDVLFRPGWLEASLELLAAFPQAGMIGAQPGFYDVMAGGGKAHQMLESSPDYALGEYQPAAEIIDEYVLGIGATGDLAAQFQNISLPAVTRREGGVQAVIGASHMQFIIPRQVARQVAPLPATRGLLRKETMSIDYKVDDLGYLHLSTTKPYVFHMGNTVNERLLSEVKTLTGKAAAPESRKAPQGASRLERGLTALARRPRFQKSFLRLYSLLFRVLYSGSVEK